MRLLKMTYVYRPKHVTAVELLHILHTGWGHYATSRKVAGSIPEVTDFFQFT
jgi:hypothetical protein